MKIKAIGLLFAVSFLIGASVHAADDTHASECKKAIEMIDQLILAGHKDLVLYELRSDALKQLKKELGKGSKN